LAVETAVRTVVVLAARSGWDASAIGMQLVAPLCIDLTNR
jgi:hypothetical protein